MVYTVTFSPCLDYAVTTEKLHLGHTNRSSKEEYTVGGKGINESVIFTKLGVENCALGFTAGFVGEYIENVLDALNIRKDFIRLDKGISRINVKIKSERETEINAKGPDIDDKSIETFMKKTDDFRDGDCLILAGSVPQSVSQTIYADILERIKDRNIVVVVDATDKLLENVLKYRPFLIKPNKDELAGFFGIQYMNDEKIKWCANELQKEGARNVLVSMGGDGAVLFTEKGNVINCGSCKGTLVNSVGSGDAMIAGFMSGYMKTGDYEYSLKLGTAAGGATAFTEWLPSKEDIMEKLGQLLTK